MEKLNKKWKVFVDRYIRGCYHCDSCPMCWSEYSYEGDGDAGCYLFGELRDTCRLLPPFRFLMGWPKLRKAQYWDQHQYDDCGEFWDQVISQDLAMEEILKDALAGYEICMRSLEDGSLLPSCKAAWLELHLANIRYGYEQKCHPYIYTPLKKEWKKVIVRTWNAFLDIFRPYFCK